MRPEESGGAAWSASSADLPDDFVPYRPGDPSEVDGVPIEQARGYVDTRRLMGGLPDRMADAEPEPPARPGSPPTGDSGGKGGRWWTESNPRRHEVGDRVRAARDLGSGIVSSTRQGEKGRVVNARHTLMGGEVFDVAFEGGYVQRDVTPDAVERRGFFD